MHGTTSESGITITLRKFFGMTCKRYTVVLAPCKHQSLFNHTWINEDLISDNETAHDERNGSTLSVERKAASKQVQRNEVAIGVTLAFFIEISNKCDVQKWKASKQQAH